MKKMVVLLLGLCLAALTAVPAIAAEPAGGAKAAPAAKDSAVPSPLTTALPLPGPRLTPADPRSGVKIGFVDMAKVASDSVPGKAATSEMKTRATRLQNQMKSREKQLSKQKAAIESTIASLSPAQREAKAKDFQKKVADYQKFVQKAGKEIQSREEQLLGNLYKSTQKAAEDYAKTNGFAAVAIKKDLLYLGDTVEAKDLTDVIIKLLGRNQTTKK
ncbi:MAG: OmpH family outer membrane protein [Geobacteraceae bacterium]|nr:OmpH family outer membrane protein [Geobacteraceae bacterium]